MKYWKQRKIFQLQATRQINTTATLPCENQAYTGLAWMEFLSYLYVVQWDVSPVEAVPVVVKVQGYSLPEAHQRESLVRAGCQVVAVNGVSHSVQDELITLWNGQGDNSVTQILSEHEPGDLFNKAFFEKWFINHHKNVIF